jgi:hypothetical protein
MCLPVSCDVTVQPDAWRWKATKLVRSDSDMDLLRLGWAAGVQPDAWRWKATKLVRSDSDMDLLRLGWAAGVTGALGALAPFFCCFLLRAG